LAGAAGHEQEDAAPGLCSDSAPLCGERVGRRPGYASPREQIGQTQHAEPTACRLEELTPAAREEWLRSRTTARQRGARCWPSRVRIRSIVIGAVHQPDPSRHIEEFTGVEQSQPEINPGSIVSSPEVFRVAGGADRRRLTGPLALDS